MCDLSIYTTYCMAATPSLAFLVWCHWSVLLCDYLPFSPQFLLSRAISQLSASAYSHRFCMHCTLPHFFSLTHSVWIKEETIELSEEVCYEKQGGRIGLLISRISKWGLQLQTIYIPRSSYPHSHFIVTSYWRIFHVADTNSRSVTGALQVTVNGWLLFSSNRLFDSVLKSWVHCSI